MLRRSGKEREVVYIYYSQVKGENGETILTEGKLTSIANNWHLNFKLQSENAAFLYVKNACFKNPPLRYRMYDEKTCVWTFLNEWGDKVLKLIKDAEKLLAIKCIEVPDLSAIASLSHFNIAAASAEFKPENFFYEKEAPTSSKTLSPEQVKVKLAALGVTDKKSYRAAALHLHPDRNNGDGSAMAELNMLWQLCGGLQ